MDFDELRTADFSLLDDAVEDWTTMVRDLDTLKDAAEKGLKKAAEKADWAGYNATVSKEFILKTAGEFADAHTEATSIRNILRDSCSELKHHQKKLAEALEHGRDKHLEVTPTDSGGFIVRSTRPGQAGQGMSVSDRASSDLEALRGEIERILGEAAESDRSAHTVLKALVDQSRLGFSDAKYADRDAAAKALKEAEDLARLAKKDLDDLTTAEFDRLNEGLKKYAKDPLFAERFATDLGPRKTLEFWADISEPQDGTQRQSESDVSRERMDKLGELQRNLGLTLATASQSDTGAMTDWKTKMVDLGDTRIDSNSARPMGFQVMSNLMRAGDYDDDFLKDYGRELMATEKKLVHEQRNPVTDRDALPAAIWSLDTQLSGDPHLNYMGQDSGSDPLTGFMKGLSNSPHAATDFFNADYRADESNFKYLFEERDWPTDINSDGDELHTGKNNLGLALEAATTGHPAGELPTHDLTPHTAGQAKLFESLVSSISDDNERLTGNSFMSDSIGQIASEYMPDINRGVNGATEPNEPYDPKDEDWIAWNANQKMFPLAGEQADLLHEDVARFLFAVGQNPEGYAAVEVGQKNYLANLMDYQIDPNLEQDKRPYHDTTETIKAISKQSGEVAGFLSLGRNQAVAGPAHEADDHYNHAVAQWKNAASGVIGTGVGIGTAFIASPVVGAAVSGPAGTVSSLVLEELFQNVEGESEDKASLQIGHNWHNGAQANKHYTGTAVAQALNAHHQTNMDPVGVAEGEAEQGYLNAYTYMKVAGGNLMTDIQP